MGAIRLIVGLGNPGREHKRDRHNVGFWLVERLAAALRVGLVRESKYHALVGRASRSDGDAWLILPQTYMNLSGKAVGALARFYKIEPEEILALDDALTRLKTEDAQASQIVELHFFAGLSIEQAAAALGISRATAYRLWTYAKAWLRCEFGGSGDAPAW